MRTGDLVYLEPLAVHALKAVDDSSVLVTLAHVAERTA
jgi:quercetin dioxygenase-like cupin family protein